VKYTARGFRNKGNFQTAIYFHCGSLDPLGGHIKSKRAHRKTVRFRSTPLLLCSENAPLRVGAMSVNQPNPEISRIINERRRNQKHVVRCSSRPMGCRVTFPHACAPVWSVFLSFEGPGQRHSAKSPK
jgi:hypothetical protein